MKEKNYQRWVGKKVRRKGSRDGMVGQVADSTKTWRWWLVEWPDGSKTQEPERMLEVVPDA
jgi:hypothetical protein